MRRVHPRSVLRCGVAALFAISVRAAGELSGTSAPRCHESYPDYCIPPPPPDLDCPDVRGPKPFRVRGADPHRFDRDRDGWACEPRPRRRP